MAVSEPKNFRYVTVESCSECSYNTSTESRKVICDKNGGYTFVVPRARDISMFICDDFDPKVKDKPKVKEE